MKKPLSWQTLGNLDEGFSGAAIDATIQDILKDCNERPGIAKSRELVIKVKFTPNSVQSAFDVVSVDVELTKKLPSRSTLTTNLNIRKQVSSTGEITSVVAELEDGAQALFPNQVYDSPNGN